MSGQGVEPAEPADGVVAVDGVVVVADGLVVEVGSVVVTAVLDVPVAAFVISAAPPAITPATASVVRTFRSCMCMSTTSVIGDSGRLPVNRSPL